MRQWMLYVLQLSGMGEAKQLVDKFNEVSAFAGKLTDDEMNDLIAS